MVTVNLRGAIFSKFKTLASFAEASGMNYSKVTRIVNGTQEPNVTEMQQMISALDIDNAEDIVSIFSLR